MHLQYFRTWWDLEVVQQSNSVYWTWWDSSKIIFWTSWHWLRPISLDVVQHSPFNCSLFNIFWQFIHTFYLGNTLFCLILYIFSLQNSRSHSPEDDDFLAAFDKMVSDNLQDRMRDNVKPQHVDIPVPLHVKTNAKKTYGMYLFYNC